MSTQTTRHLKVTPTPAEKRAKPNRTLASDIEAVKFWGRAVTRELGRTALIGIGSAVAVGALAMGADKGFHALQKANEATSAQEHEKARDTFMSEIREHPENYEMVAPKPGDGVERLVRGLDPVSKDAASELTLEIRAQANGDGGLDQRPYYVKIADVGNPNTQGAPLTLEDIPE